ncbi:MAG TPA: hypothetical protein DER60_05605 [Syntrophomonas sp.]|jgi:hypothetical protein|nr:hypothetical protein [Syntrophomonas sp.]
MRLDRGNRSILAYFRDEGEAAKAAQVLTRHGFQDISVDTIVPVPGRTVYSTPATSLTALVLGSGRARQGHHQILLGSDPDVSGMAGSFGSDQGGYNHILTMTADNDQADIATRLLRECGALV